jgi:DNA polymerase-3 subunit delta
MTVSPNVYIFLGPELGKKQDEVDAIKQKLPNAETTVFYAGETPVSTMTDTIQNNSLFSEKHLIIIKNTEVIKKKDDVELLVSCIKNIDEDTTVIILSDEIKLASAIDDAVPKNNRKIFYELFEREKNEWLKQFFKREGFNIDKDCIAIILEMVENNTEALKRECSRLVYFLPRNKDEKESQVNAQDIEKWLSHNREESAFTLFSRIAAGDLSKALESLSVMLAAKESAQNILAGLAWCFRKLGDYLFLLETGDVNNNFELKKIGLSSPKARDDYATASRRYNAESAEACLALTAEYDNLLRSPVGVMERILMDRYIYKVIGTSKV